MNNNTQNESLSQYIHSIQESVDRDLAHNYMTVREASNMLKVHSNTIYRTIKAGDLKAHNIGIGPSGKNAYRISMEDMEDYLANRVASCK